MLLSVLISLNEQLLVVVLMNCEMIHGKLDLGHLNMGNLLLTVLFLPSFSISSSIMG
jgi:type III secretory pathway component EscV